MLATRRREATATGAALLALGVAVGAAMLTRGQSGLSLVVTDLSIGALGVLQTVGEAVPLGYALGVGMAAAVNPCGFALLPAYLGLYLGADAVAGGRRDAAATLARALLVSGSVAASFVLLFGAFGLLLSAAASVLVPYLAWVSLSAGILLVLAGGRVLVGGSLYVGAADRLADSLGERAGHVGLAGYSAFGLAYALGSLGCTLPLFLTVVGTALTR
jgi:cytochrome c-type biogenesis protein